ncbi:trans-aconitate 2-methyltransferase [Anatilimnocola aggregata]|uniref:Trans-aconitate 2-methyltransferase n=1 Tax=Anatilimnocola aggregata TaxID=2528021 RepID=A0A517YIE1_9BACT|nr:class I SAM-dependent methyltransferase [Anatilimnocola aggregata]QDU30000.1 trans-aconitate 2-methyltransferase [Anatilimnocola aggregata]
MSAENAYDEVLYESHPFAQTHPNRLATIGQLFGMQPAPLAKCRVLELGCSSGGNIIPLAERFPQSEFVGIDASSRQVAIGQKTVQALNLPNLQLLHEDILKFSPQQGKFDYIIAHGVFSWVPPNVQDAILHICHDHLTPNGIAYISYNTNPGWRLRGMIRDIMTYRARKISNPAEKLRESRALLDFLAESVSTKGNAYGILLADEVNHIRPKQDWYLIHEYLEEVNEPEYFHQFMDRAHLHNLQYLGEADYSTMLASNFPPEVEAMLKKLGTDIIETEQYMDMVRNRLFRQTLLCQSAVTLDRTIPPERIFNMHVASSSEPEGGVQVDPRSWDPVTFKRPGSTLSTKEPLLKAAMLELRAAWPRAIPFMELLSNARGRLHPGTQVIDAERAANDAKNLARPLLRCYATTHVDLHAEPPQVAYLIPEQPAISRLARFQASQPGAVTNLMHEVVQLGDFERQVAKLLDGSRDRAAVIETLTDLVAKKTLVVHEKGKPVADLDQVRVILGKVLEDALPSLARKNLLLPQ